jgi:hypothetical protein
MGVSIFSTILSETFLILRKIKRYTIANVHTSLRNVTYSCQILIKSEFSRQAFENNSIPNFMQIRHVRSKLFHTNTRQREKERARAHAHAHKHTTHTNTRTDITKITVHFRKFANAPKSDPVPHITTFSHYTVDTSHLQLCKC